MSEASVIVMPAWALGPSLTLPHAEAGRALLLDALPILQNDPRLDLSGVTEIDASGVQLLLALRTALAQAGQVLQLIDPSVPVRDALAQLELARLFPVVPDRPTA